MTVRRFLLLTLATLVIALVVTVVLLAPVEGSPDRGILPPVDRPPPAQPLQ